MVRDSLVRSQDYGGYSAVMAPAGGAGFSQPAQQPPGFAAAVAVTVSLRLGESVSFFGGDEFFEIFANLQFLKLKILFKF